METIQQSADILVVGAGLAGLRAALEVCQSGYSVALVAKGDSLTGSNSSIASGGFATAIPEIDSPDQHRRDMLEGGYKVNDQNLVRLICDEAFNCLSELDLIVGGFPQSGGQFVGDPVPAHSYPRSIRYPAGMSNLINKLGEKLAEYPSAILKNYRVIDLIKSETGGIVGAFLYSEEKNRIVEVHARSTILATGGCGYLFPVTSNSTEITGDGSAIALRAGCRLRDMEFIQFTPTAFAAPPAIRGRTISGSLLAVEGVELLNKSGERFMTRYAPETLERSNRAVVSRAIFREIREGRGTEAGGVYMDLTRVPVDHINSLRPGLADFCFENGIDVRVQPLETAPAVHTSLGGISVDSQLSAARNLFVAGEAIGGTHGANRLSSNSLTEANVTGKFAARAALENLRTQSNLLPTERQVAEKSADCLPNRGEGNTLGLIEEIRELMGHAAGIERDEETLRTGLNKLTDLELRHQSYHHSGTDSLGRWLDIRNMLLTGRAILESAMERKESRGAHYRTDYPNTDDENWMVNIYAEISASTQIKVDVQDCKTK